MKTLEQVKQFMKYKVAELDIYLRSQYHHPTFTIKVEAYKDFQKDILDYIDLETD